MLNNPLKLLWPPLIVIVFLALLFSHPAHAQSTAAAAPANLDISAWYRQKTTDTPLYRWVKVDSPLTFTLDSAKVPHIGISLPLVGIAIDVLVDGKKVGSSPNINFATGRGLSIAPVTNADGSITLKFSMLSGCTFDAQGNATCPSPDLPPVAPAQYVKDEVPIPGTVPGTWTLQHPSNVIAHPFCSVDGVLQGVDRDFTIAGNTLTAKWDPSKKILCSYSWGN